MGGLFGPAALTPFGGRRRVAPTFLNPLRGFRSNLFRFKSRLTYEYVSMSVVHERAF
jgi:hypothetical protein